MSGADPLVGEALRLNGRYVEEVVLGWGLCPWAAQAWRARAVERRVLVEPAPDVDAVVDVIDALAARPEISIGLVIFPRAAADAAGWGSFAERVRRADRARRAPGVAAPFLLAAFHPLAGARSAEARDAGALVSLLRRTPDPTLQLVRAELLARLGPEVSGEIARANFAAVGARTPAALDALLDDLRRDRDAAYARL